MLNVFLADSTPLAQKLGRCVPPLKVALAVCSEDISLHPD